MEVRHLLTRHTIPSFEHHLSHFLPSWSETTSPPPSRTDCCADLRGIHYNKPIRRLARLGPILFLVSPAEADRLLQHIGLSWDDHDWLILMNDQPLVENLPTNPPDFHYFTGTLVAASLAIHAKAANAAPNIVLRLSAFVAHLPTNKMAIPE